MSWISPSQPLFIASFPSHLETIPVAQFLHDVTLATKKCEEFGSRVLLNRTDFYEFAVWFIALAKLGKTIVLPPNAQPTTLTQVETHCDSVCSAVLLQGEAVAPAEIYLSNNTKVVFFTSGSSGEPKLITKKIDQLWLESQQLERVFSEQLVESAVFAATVPVNHIYGLLFRLLWPLQSGKTMYRLSLEYSETLQQLLKKHAVTLIASPVHLVRFAQALETSNEHNHGLTIFSSGGPLSADTASTYETCLGNSPIEVFGSTETGGIGWRRNAGGETPWRPFPQISIKLNSQRCLEIKSPYIDSEAWFTTQDKAELIGAEEFRLLGRSDRIVKVAEKRVSLPEVESFAKQLPWVADIKAILLQGKRDYLGAVIVLNDIGRQQLESGGKLFLNQQIRDCLAQRFDRVALPRKFRYVDALPCDERGKTPLRFLEELFE
ncbi:AMP-binding protein [Aliidiomarina indica]|uniref:AMP-binding protein n=1 Tax=Aliidiomarina indica TaxID=2749147 RepID=UPI001890ACB0|nr:AMP-binding protein [Aliidiomarina indica]